MTEALPDSIAALILGLELGSLEQAASNRFSLEGLTCATKPDGLLEIGIRSLRAASLRLASGPFQLEVGELALDRIVAQVRVEGGTPRLHALEAGSAELSGVEVRGPLLFSGRAKGDSHASADSWSLGPLGTADGTIRAEIVDAHLVFDADVTVPIRQGLIDFKDASVEHVGPDSRMGVSRLGLYVDAPNGRSYLYQFPSAPVAGVQYERRGTMLGPWVSDRGSLRLQPFGEALLRQACAAHGGGFTVQARQLFDRTAVSGEVQLGDGKFAAPGVQAEVVGRAEGRNLVRVHSEAVGRGLTAEMHSLSVRDAALDWRGTQLRCGEMAGALALRVFVDGGQLRFGFKLVNLKLSGLRLQPQHARPQALA